jgi:class 3 adenylate cyclase
MGTAERRQEHRTNSGLRFTPVNCTLITDHERINLEVINFHYRGACLKVSVGDYRFQQKGSYLLFKIGLKELSEKITFRITWETVSENGFLGVEFSTESSYVLARAERFMVHSINTPVISSQDPLDPNRIIYFKVVNASTTGMLVSTSLSNKHLFPGMELRTAVLNIPNIGKTDLDLFIENSRQGDENNILFGMSIKGSSHNYNTLMAKYLSNLGSADNNDERIEKLTAANFIQKELRAHLTIKEIKTQGEYEKVLKLRFMGYSIAGKVEKTKTWAEMGDGLKNEGIILGAFLGGQLVASCEFRFNHIHKIRLGNALDINQIPGVRSQNLAEINKLVVHPNAQNSDIVLGIFQKIHALAMLNGRPDGLIAAEPKLVSLYERLGFKKTGYSFPHPVKPQVSLSLMIIYSEAYASSEGMNPYAWSVAFSETQKFLNEIGINQSKKFSLLQTLQKITTKAVLFLKFSKKQKKQPKKKTEASEDHLTGRNVCDPKWTKQHLNATILLPFILESQELIGGSETKRILFDFGFDIDYFRSVSNWLSVEFFDEFIDKFSQFGDPYILNKKAGYRSITKEVLGSNYFIVKHFFSPGIAFKTFEKFLPKFNKTRIYQVVDSGSTFCKIRITNPDKSLLPKHPSAKENWYAIAEAYVLALTGKPALIKPIKSAFDGDEYCEFIVSWQNPLFSLRTVILTAFFISGISILGHLAYSTFSTDTLGSIVKISVVLGTLIFLGSRALLYRGKYREMIESLTEYEKHADERYKELQNSKSILEKSYQEGRTLEAINRDIQTSDDLSQILQTALSFLSQNFELTRSFVMIKDEGQQFLRTAAVFGAENPLYDLWKFKVDISVKRDNPLVLSSVYHYGQSILVTDISEHKYHLNESSKALLEKLQTDGFAMVPIPSENGNWGVLVSDKGRKKNLITRRDLVVLQRVAQSIGMALDKKSKIESEIHIRKIFQKYVPSSIVEGTLGSTGPKLGGQSREAICLFLDIRNFTTLSTQIPPEILCELLNEIFNIVNINATKTNGIIDKFLGDGALVTWGAVPGSELSPENAIATARQILVDLMELNQKICEKGLKPIEVGIGIHKGSVIAGNIGSQDRMEFTVIGNTVNLASRLEQLTKVYKCQVVISSALTDLQNLDSSWTVHEGVQVRGIEGTMKIATYTHLLQRHQPNSDEKHSA